ncbi:MAG: M28 family peptidase [Cytophagaceae bacterium]|nr:M28 family peptidase [Cytophagaceae bacterium]MDW8456332.1 M28 family peptidase [Cytophagaceae bacterium]
MMKTRKSFCFHITLIASYMLILASSCTQEKNNPSQNNTEITETSSTTLVATPDFNADSAYQYIAKQISFGPRVPNTASHVQCADYLARQMKKYGATVIEQDFTATAYDGTVLRAKNIISSYNLAANKRILLAAHWDTRPFSDEDPKAPQKKFDGANDGASGVAVLMEIARCINASNMKPVVGIDMIFFDVEDYGMPNVQDSYCLGSQYWGKNKHTPQYSAYYGILLDMVGAKGAVFSKEYQSMMVAPSIVNLVWSKAAMLGYDKYFINQTVSSITDDHVYVTRYTNIPMIDIIEYHPNKGFGSYWHTQADNLQVIDKATLKAVGQTLLQVIYSEK